MSKIMKCVIAIASVFGFIAVILIGWLVYILTLAPEKHIFNTYTIGEQVVSKIDPETGETIESSAPVCEISIYNNAFELKFNEMYDENKNSFYSSGVQYIAKDYMQNILDFSVKTKSIYTGDFHDFSNYNIVSTDSEAYKADMDVSNGKKGYLWAKSGNDDFYYYRNLMIAENLSNINVYQYQSVDENSFINNDMANPLNEDSIFKFVIDGEIYGFSLKNENTDYNNSMYCFSETKHVSTWGAFNQMRSYRVDEYYRAYDLHFFAEMLYNSFSSVPSGTSQNYIIRMADYFDYYVYDGQGYKLADNLTFSKLVEHTNTNMTIKVNKYDYLLDSSSKSSFNCYKGLENVIDEDIEDSVLDYKTSKNIITLTLADFDFISTDKSGEYILKFSKNENLNIIDNSVTLYEIYLDITDYGISIKGVDLNSISGLNIYSAILIISGVESEVVYV